MHSNEGQGTACHDSLATKSELFGAMNKQAWRVIGAMMTLCTLLTGAVFYVARNVHPN